MRTETATDKANRLFDDFGHRTDWAKVMRAASADRPDQWLLRKDRSGTLLRNWSQGIAEARCRFEATPEPVTEFLTVRVGDTIQRTLGSVTISSSRFTITDIDHDYGLIEGHVDGEIDIDEVTADNGWSVV